MVNIIKAFKTITNPVSLEPNALYLKRSGQGFDLSATTSDEFGSIVSLPLNTKKNRIQNLYEKSTTHRYFGNEFEDGSWVIKRYTIGDVNSEVSAIGSSGFDWSNRESEVYS